MKKILLASTLISMCVSNLLAQESNLTSDTKIEAQKEDNHKPATEKLDKTGFFIGGGIGLGGSDNGKIRITSIGKEAGEEGTFDSGTYVNNTFFTTDINITGGYQKYFGEAQKQGVRGVFQAGFSIKTNVSTGGAQYTTLSGFNIAISADYLYDFWASGKQTLGVSAGLGYKYNAGFLGSLDDKKTGILIIKTILGSRIDYHSITERIGIHYYYGRHQIECLLSLEPVIGGRDSFDYTVPDYPPTRVRYTNSFYYNFNLNYTYRF